jgi:GPH family glycoside/pentoside/hexuronide:cation symporter
VPHSTLVPAAAVEPAPNAAASPDATPLAWRTIVAYGLPNLGATFVSTLFTVMFLKFCTDRLHVSPIVMGAIFLVAKVWNALADPLVGSWGDRTRSRFGRRRLWLFGASLPLALFVAMLWGPPAALDGDALVVWVAVSVVGYYTAISCVYVPHAALGVELTEHPPSRNRIFGAKHFLGVFGLGLAVACIRWVDDPETGRQNAALIGMVGGAATALAIAGVLPFLPRERADFQGRGGSSLRHAYRDVTRNREARLLLFVFFVESLGLGGLSVLVPYVTQYIMHRQDLTEAMLGVYIGAGFLAVPVWLLLARRFEKQTLWLAAMVLGAVGFGSLIFLGENGWPLMVFSSLLAGSAGACTNSIGQSLKADVIDLDELRTGERKEGAYFAAWSFVMKLGNAFLASSTGFALGLAGYVENQEQTETVKRTMLFLLGGMPLLGYGVGAWVFARFSLTRAQHEEVLRQLAERRASGAR